MSLNVNSGSASGPMNVPEGPAVQLQLQASSSVCRLVVQLQLQTSSLITS